MRAAMGARLTAGTAGVAMLGFGAWHLLTDSDLGRRESIGKWLLGGVIVHDGIIAPVVFACCALAWRFAGVRLRRGLAVFLLTGGSVAIVALPSALRSGDNPNPTVTPLDYPRNLALVLGGLVVCVLLYVLGGRLNDRRRAIVATTPTEDSPAIPGPEPSREADGLDGLDELDEEPGPADVPAPVPEETPDPDKSPEHSEPDGDHNGADRHETTDGQG